MTGRREPREGESRLAGREGSAVCGARFGHDRSALVTAETSVASDGLPLSRFLIGGPVLVAYGRPVTEDLAAGAAHRND